MTRAALTLLLLTSALPARADGLRFDGEQPGFEHAWLALTPGQAAALAEGDAPGSHPVVQLTRPQREQLRKATGKDVRWLFAPSRAAIEGDCTCGAYNLAVRIGGRLAVFLPSVGDFLSPAEASQLALQLTDPRLAARDGADAAARPRCEDGPPEAAPPALEAVRELLGSGSFPRSLAIPAGWQAVEVKLGSIPAVLEAVHDAFDVVALEALVSAAPAAGRTIDWPALGARRAEPDGGTTYVVPFLVIGELGPPARTWLVLRYRGGRLLDGAFLTDQGYAAGVTCG